MLKIGSQEFRHPSSNDLAKLYAFEAFRLAGCSKSVVLYNIVSSSIH